MDATELRSATAQGRTDLTAGRATPARVSFLRAVETWSGEPLAEDVYDEWTSEPVIVLVAAYLEALEGGTVASLEIGDPATASRLALCLVATGHAEEAGPAVELAVSTETPLTAYEAQWAEAGYLAATAHADAATRAASAARVAEAGGYLVSVERLRALAGSLSSA